MLDFVSHSDFLNWRCWSSSLGLLVLAIRVEIDFYQLFSFSKSLVWFCAKLEKGLEFYSIAGSEVFDIKIKINRDNF